MEPSAAFPGRSMRHDDAAPVLIFDLDETVLRINSFPLWGRYMIAGRLPGIGAGGRAVLALRVLSLAARRKLGLIDHDTLLRRLRLAWRQATQDHDAAAAVFQARLMREVRPCLHELLRQVAEHEFDAVLATAAAFEYADGLARQLGFRHILATGPDYVSPRNSGTTKRDRVMALLHAQNWQTRPRMLFTDHLDDLPLMRECDAVCWFGRDGTCPDGINLVPCLNLDAGGFKAAFDRALRRCQAAP